MTAKPTPKIYAKRPPCKWHGYDCHRSVNEGDTLCALHLVSARAKNGLDHSYKPGYRGPLTEEDRDRIAAGIAADLGCDCTDCLEKEAWR